MSSPASGIVSTPTIYGKVDFGPTFGAIYRPLNTKRVITAAGIVVILPFDVFVIVKQAVPGNFSVVMPDLALWMRQPYGGFALTIANKNIGFEGIITPFGIQTIDGQANFTLGDSQGVGAVTFMPLNDMSGWETI